MIDYILLEKYTKDISILVVEDDAITANEIKELLNELTSRVYVANDGKEAFEKYLNFKKEKNSYFDLVITDIQMPKLDGIELVKLIKEENLSQKIVVLSAHNETKYLMELINLGINQFVLKPFNYEEFIDMLFKISKQIYNEKNKKRIVDKIIKLSDDLLWDSELNKLISNEKEIKLTKKELMLLKVLLKIPDKTCTNEEILSKIWTSIDEENADISNLKNIISRFRKKLPKLNLENVYGFGYRIITIN